MKWAAAQVGADAHITGRTGLREGSNPWLLSLDVGGRPAEAVLRVGGPNSRASFATEVAALTVAAAHGVPAPRLIAADTDGGVAGCPAVLTTVVTGHSRIPATPPAGRLRTLGATAAALHAVPLSARPELPLRTRSIPLEDFAAMRRAAGAVALLEEAEELVRSVPMPAGESVFVHGDLWQGNTMWAGDDLVGVIDWDCAGVGHPGIDLGSLRCDAAIQFGVPAAAEVLAGWEQASGRAADSVAYWDVVAALSTPPDLAMWVPVMHDQGRSDLTAATLQERRDKFLRTALDRYRDTETAGRSALR